jgi:hypothetical protein
LASPHWGTVVRQELKTAACCASVRCARHRQDVADLPRQGVGGRVAVAADRKAKAAEVIVHTVVAVPAAVPLDQPKRHDRTAGFRCFTGNCPVKIHLGHLEVMLRGNQGTVANPGADNMDRELCG